MATKKYMELDFLSFPVLARIGLDSNRQCIQAVAQRQAEYTDREAQSSPELYKLRIFIFPLTKAQKGEVTCTRSCKKQWLVQNQIYLTPTVYSLESIKPFVYGLLFHEYPVRSSLLYGAITIRSEETRAERT